MPDFTIDEPIEAILFDLDGTLLRIHMEQFILRYTQRLTDFFADELKPQLFGKAMVAAIRRLIQETGDGAVTNEQRLHSYLHHELGLTPERFAAGLAHFEHHHLDELKDQVQAVPLAVQIVKECRQRRIPLVLATNPVFPRFMIDARMRWAGLDAGDFAFITTYENSRYCKPQPGYFRDIAQRLDLPASRCLMVGNDTSHDLAAVTTGMRAFLVDTWLVEREEQRWPSDYRGDHGALQNFLRTTL